MVNEIWKKIKGYELYYEISNIGRVRTIPVKGQGRRNKSIILSQGTSTSGYKMVILRSNNKSKAAMIHRIVCQNFLPNINNFPCVNHINGVKTDNRLDNLEWATHKLNSTHALLTGLWVVARGGQKPNSKFNFQQVQAIKKLLSEGAKVGVVARKFEVNSSVISGIKSGRCYKTW